MTDLTKLKELAERSTPGEWEMDGWEVGPASEPNASIAKCSKREDAAWIAAANPQAILGLISEVERLRAITSTCMGVGDGSGNLFVHGDYDSIKAAQAIVFRMERLKAENEALLDAAKHCRELFMRYEINRVDGEEISEAALEKLNAAINAALEGGGI